MNVDVCLHLFTYVCIFVHMWVCEYVYIYIYIYIFYVDYIITFDYLEIQNIYIYKHNINIFIDIKLY